MLTLLASTQPADQNNNNKNNFIVHTYNGYSHWWVHKNKM